MTVHPSRQQLCRQPCCHNRKGAGVYELGGSLHQHAPPVLPAHGYALTAALAWQDLQWEFAVVDDPQLNAMAAPGGKVVVFTGLLKALQQEDQLAAVLSHEIAHVVARHTVRPGSRVSTPGFSYLLSVRLDLVMRARAGAHMQLGSKRRHRVGGNACMRLYMRCIRALLLLPRGSAGSASASSCCSSAEAGLKQASNC